MIYQRFQIGMCFVNDIIVISERNVCCVNYELFESDFRTQLSVYDGTHHIVSSVRQAKRLRAKHSVVPSPLDSAVGFAGIRSASAVAFPAAPVAVEAIAVALHQRPVPVRHTADHLPQVRGSLAREDRGLSEVADAEHSIRLPDTNARNRIGAVVALFK